MDALNIECSCRVGVGAGGGPGDRRLHVRRRAPPAILTSANPYLILTISRRGSPSRLILPASGTAFGCPAMGPERNAACTDASRCEPSDFAAASGDCLSI